MMIRNIAQNANTSITCQKLALFSFCIGGLLSLESQLSFFCFLKGFRIIIAFEVKNKGKRAAIRDWNFKGTKSLLRQLFNCFSDGVFSLKIGKKETGKVFTAACWSFHLFAVPSRDHGSRL